MYRLDPHLSSLTQRNAALYDALAEAQRLLDTVLLSCKFPAHANVWKAEKIITDALRNAEKEN